MESTQPTDQGPGATAPIVEGPAEGLASQSSEPRHGVMRAIVQDAYGSREVFRLAEIDRPQIAADEVLVQVSAAGMDRGTWHLMTGRPYLMRIMGFGFRRPNNRVPGLDVAGTVVAVGSGVTRFQSGDEVFGISRGSFAEYAAAREDKLAHKPAGLTFEQAAVVPISGGTALQGLRDAGGVKAGGRVLVIGASGGVGTYAVQLAKAFGAEVTGVCSTSKVDLVRSIGADHVIDYSREDYAGGARRYDLILDIGGNRSLSATRRVLTPHGTVVLVAPGRGQWIGPISRILGAAVTSRFGSQKVRPFLTPVSKENLLVLKELIEAGKITPVIDRTYPFDQIPEAVRYVEAGHAQGKVVITL